MWKVVSLGPEALRKAPYNSPANLWNFPMAIPQHMGHYSQHLEENSDFVSK